MSLYLLNSVDIPCCFVTQARRTLEEISKVLMIDMPVLLLTWCPKILASSLVNWDATELFRLLTFLEGQIGCDAKELLQRVLPSLLDELVLLLGRKTSSSSQRLVLIQARHLPCFCV